MQIARSTYATWHWDEAVIRGWLIEDLAAPRKQRHTARRIWQRLIEQEGARVAESTVRNLVARLKTEIGADRQQVSVPQTHRPAEEAEVDFGEFTAVIAGVVMKLFMFCLRLSLVGIGHMHRRNPGLIQNA